MLRTPALVALVSLAPLVLPAPIRAQANSAEQVLCRVDIERRAELELLLDEGLIVSVAWDDWCAVFGGADLPNHLQRLGFSYSVLDADAAQHDHYVVGAARVAVDPRSERMRVLETAREVAIVATARDDVGPVLTFGHDVTRLFPTPMRLPAHAPRTWERERLAAPASVVQDLVMGVDSESLSTYVSVLEAFGTRNAEKPEAREAAEWIAAKFRSFGIEQVQIRNWTARFAGNVVATIPGTVAPRDVYVLGGHYDSIAFESDLEPGADDNASGTAALLEVARHLASQRFASTVQIVAFGAEEYGLVGSDVFARGASARGERIRGMINLDMLGHVAPGDRRDLDIISNDMSQWLRDAAHDVAGQYVPALSVINGKLMQGNSDHSSFWRQGYDAIFFFEDSVSPSPFIHTPDDVTGFSYNDVELHTLCTQTALALLMTLAEPLQVPVALQSFTVALESNAVRLSWELSGAAQRGLESVGVQRALEVRGPYEDRVQALPPTATFFLDDDTPDHDLWYRLAFDAANGRRTYSQPRQVSPGRGRTGLDAVVSAPADGAVHIRYAVAPAPELVRIGIYDVRGRLVRRLVDGWVEPGAHLQTWDLHDRAGHPVSSGIYFVHLRGARTAATRKALVTSR